MCVSVYTVYLEDAILSCVLKFTKIRSWFKQKWGFTGRALTSPIKPGELVTTLPVMQNLKW